MTFEGFFGWVSIICFIATYILAKKQERSIKGVLIISFFTFAFPVTIFLYVTRKKQMDKIKNRNKYWDEVFAYESIEDIPGLTENKLKALKEQFPTTNDIVNADTAEITKVPGISEKIANAIKIRISKKLN